MIKGSTATMETRLKMSKSHIGLLHTEEEKEKIGKAHIGRKFSEETLAKMSIAKKGKPLSETHRINIIKAITGRRHSMETRQKMSDAQKGEKGSGWKGGKSTENEKLRASAKMHIWRNSCFLRDDFTCRKTGQRGGRLVVHHINNFADYPELRFVLENGVTLSREAHLEFHKRYGKRNNTAYQLNEFLKLNG